MNKTFRTVFTALAFAGAAFGLQAQTPIKLAVVDMEQVFQQYYKTEAQQAKLKEDEKKAREQLDSIGKERDALVTEAKELQEQTKSAILSDEARKKAQADLEAKVGEIREKEGQLQGFAQQLQQEFQKRIAKYQSTAAEEIAKVATSIAKAKGANLVLNKGASAVVIYADETFEITSEVLTEVNKDRPPTITVAPAAAPAK